MGVTAEKAIALLDDMESAGVIEFSTVTISSLTQRRNNQWQRQRQCETFGTTTKKHS